MIESHFVKVMSFGVSVYMFSKSNMVHIHKLYIGPHYFPRKLEHKVLPIIHDI